MQNVGHVTVAEARRLVQDIQTEVEDVCKRAAAVASIGIAKAVTMMMMTTMIIMYSFERKIQSCAQKPLLASAAASCAFHLSMLQGCDSE